MNNRLGILNRKFKRLLNIVEGQRPGFINALGSGFSLEEIQNALPNRTVPDELKCIYLSVGKDPPSGGGFLRYLMPIFEFIPLHHIQETMNTSNILALEYPEVNEYKVDMIPFLFDQSGDYYYFRTLSKDRSVHYIDKEGNRFYECSDLGIFFDMLFEQYEANVYFMEDGGWLECDADLEEEIAQKYSSQGY